MNAYLGHKPLLKPYVVLTQRDTSPCILRVDKIKSREEVKGGCRILYDDREYLVRESFLKVGKLINEAKRKFGDDTDR